MRIITITYQIDLKFTAIITENLSIGTSLKRIVMEMFMKFSILPTLRTNQ